jgi:hypothetical protein
LVLFFNRACQVLYSFSNMKGCFQYVLIGAHVILLELFNLSSINMFDLYFGEAFDGFCYLLSVCVEME